jgi:hypothetical protein
MKKKIREAAAQLLEAATLTDVIAIRRTIVGEVSENWVKSMVRLAEGAEPETHRSVYVVELDKSVWECTRCAGTLRLDGGTPEENAFYIGATSHAVGHRIKQHRDGVKSSHFVREHFLRRAEELEPHFRDGTSWEARISRPDAEWIELHALPKLLRQLGYSAHSR